MRFHSYRMILLFIFTCSLILILLPFTTHCINPYDRDMMNDLVTYNCHRYHRCRSGGPKICGFDEKRLNMAEFEDICTLYKVNCRRVGTFKIVDNSLCDAKKSYTSEYNDTFEFVPVKRPTTSIPDTTTKFAEKENFTGSSEDYVKPFEANASTNELKWFPSLVRLVHKDDLD